MSIQSVSLHQSTRHKANTKISEEFVSVLERFGDEPIYEDKYKNFKVICSKPKIISGKKKITIDGLKPNSKVSIPISGTSNIIFLTLEIVKDVSGEKIGTTEMGSGSSEKTMATYPIIIHAHSYLKERWRGTVSHCLQQHKLVMDAHRNQSNTDIWKIIYTEELNKPAYEFKAYEIDSIIVKKTLPYLAHLLYIGDPKEGEKITKSFEKEVYCGLATVGVFRVITRTDTHKNTQKVLEELAEIFFKRFEWECIMGLRDISSYGNLGSRLNKNDENHYFPNSVRIYPDKERTRELSLMPYKEYLMQDEWKIISQAAKKAAGNQCLLCPRSSNLNTHHRRYPSNGGSARGYESLRNDLLVLCRECHSRHHGMVY